MKASCLAPGSPILVKIARFKFSVVELLEAGESLFTVDDSSDGCGTLLDVAYSLQTRLYDFSDDLHDRCKPLSVQDAKDAWLDHIASLAGICDRRISRGETILDNDGATARLRNELVKLRVHLASLYPGARLAELEALERAVPLIQEAAGQIPASTQPA